MKKKGRLTVEEVKGVVRRMKEFNARGTMLSIKIETIPHKKQRYPSVGDWQTKKGTAHILVSELGDPRYELLVAIHELVEKTLCDAAGVTEKMVDDFDMAYEVGRKAGNPSCQGEPGDAPDSPYRDAHCFATAVERMLCAALGVPWDAYEAAIEALG